MSEIAERIKTLVCFGEVRISEHGYNELAEDGLTVKEILSGIDDFVVVEEYPDFPKGACVLLMQKDIVGNPIHVVWGIPKGYDRPAVLVTAYRPEKALWDNDFIKRRKK